MDSSFVQRRLPAAIASLAELTLDLRWTWSHAGDQLWRAIDEDAWNLTQNPWFILQSAPESRLEELARDPIFRGELERLMLERESYLALLPALPVEDRIAYFSMEFGLGAAVPLYAGGLGILAGDYLKTASDLGLPAVGVGILYQEGYFRQTVDASGLQHESYPYNDPSTLPLSPALSPDGSWARVAVTLPGRALWVRVWRARVGRTALYLLDGNDPENSPADRGITSKLYPNDPETRMLQAMVLGIGGPRALAAVGVTMTVAHLNESHSAFVVLDRARSFALAERTSFREALWATRAGNLFTTHTPVRASLERFPADLVRKHFSSGSEYMSSAGLSADDLLELGRSDSNDEMRTFSMAHLALRGSARVNGVSRVHAGVSRKLFAGSFPRWPVCEVPVDHVTNGVHVPTWDSRGADELWTRACGKGRWLGSIDALCGSVSGVSDEELWALKAAERRELVRYARARLRFHLARRSDTEAERASRVLDPNVLTLGFARRFAEYKRPNLLLADPERLARLLSDSDRPVQIVVAGKAHPSDEPGKSMIAQWMQFFGRPDVRNHGLFLEDYDMAVAEEMVHGVDVWINTPRPPWEACGTSGMKVLVNGGLNVSNLDGWWAEAWSPEVGWAIGGDAQTDEGAAALLYTLLERDIVPEFYDRDPSGIPRTWVSRIRASVSRLTPRFSSNRMVREYAENYYRPLAEAFRRRTANGGAVARELSAWGETLVSHFHQIHFGSVDVQETAPGLRFRAAVYLGEVEPRSIAVELYADAESGHGTGERVAMICSGDLTGATNGHVYEATVTTTRPSTDFTLRVVAHHPEAFLPAELPAILWQR